MQFYVKLRISLGCVLKFQRERVDIVMQNKLKMGWHNYEYEKKILNYMNEKLDKI